MNQAMRQRVLGLLVLVALASVLLPLLLDFGGHSPIDTQSRIPPAPDITPHPVLDPSPTAQPPDAAVPADRQEQLFQLAPGEGGAAGTPASATATATPAATPSGTAAAGAAKGVPAKSLPEEPRLDAKGLPASWVLQAGAFQDKANAEELRDRLLKDGHHAFVQSSVAGGKATHRVFVGPKMTREQLVAEQAVLQRKFGVKTMVVPFTP